MATATTIDRIPPQEAKRRMGSTGALLVGAYEDPSKFQQYRLPGAISLRDFQSQSASLDKEHEIIFYCA